MRLAKNRPKIKQARLFGDGCSVKQRGFDVRQTSVCRGLSWTYRRQTEVCRTIMNSLDMGASHQLYPREFMSEAPKHSSPKLVRGFSLLDATMIVVGSMIGSGIFITSAESARLVGSPGWLLAAWGLAGLLTITGALCCAELAAMWPRAGGQYVFLS